MEEAVTVATKVVMANVVGNAVVAAAYVAVDVVFDAVDEDAAVLRDGGVDDDDD